MTPWHPIDPIHRRVRTGSGPFTVAAGSPPACSRVLDDLGPRHRFGRGTGPAGPSCSRSGAGPARPRSAFAAGPPGAPTCWPSTSTSPGVVSPARGGRGRAAAQPVRRAGRRASSCSTTGSPPAASPACTCSSPIRGPRAGTASGVSSAATCSTCSPTAWPRARALRVATDVDRLRRGRPRRPRRPSRVPTAGPVERPRGGRSLATRRRRLDAGRGRDRPRHRRR